MTTDLQEWLAQRAENKQLLYEQYGKALEKDHTGEYVAIGPDGKTILGKGSGRGFTQSCRCLWRKELRNV